MDFMHMISSATFQFGLDLATTASIIGASTMFITNSIRQRKEESLEQKAKLYFFHTQERVKQMGLVLDGLAEQLKEFNAIESAIMKRLAGVPISEIESKQASDNYIIEICIKTITYLDTVAKIKYNVWANKSEILILEKIKKLIEEYGKVYMGQGGSPDIQAFKSNLVEQMIELSKSLNGELKKYEQGD